MAISRRELLRDAAAAGAAVALAGPTTAQGRVRRARSGPRVAVLGGGMAGLAAAHELVERGFAVTVYERKALGGKARSIPVAGSAQGGRRELPGEHGFRFFPGFYHHVPDTMRRIPFAGNQHGVWDNLVDAPGAVISRAGSEDIFAPLGFTAQTPAAVTPQALQETLVGAVKLLSKVPPNELALFVERLMVFLTSCDERRYGQWEHTSWLQFVRAEGKSQEYQRVLVSGLTRVVVAAKEQVASSRTIGNMAEAFVLNIAGLGNDGAPDRLLNAPTNEAWIDPWILHLKSLGVEFATGWTIGKLNIRGGKIAGARARDARGNHRTIDAEWFVCALPVERARRLWSPGVLALDPQLELMNELFVDWMNGIQFYLRRQVPFVAGHMAYMDSPWSITSISQAQFWHGRDLARDYGDGQVKDVLSCDISDWDTPGILYGKPAKRCSRQEVADEVWAQIKAHVDDTRPGFLRDDDLHSWFLDPAIAWAKSRGQNRNDDPLLVNTIGSWDKRPQSATKIPNLFLAGDYVQTNIDLATMEGANESARTAVSALLEASGSNAPRPTMYKLYQPPELDAVKSIDRQRYKAGQPNLLDTP
jgi:uncharacterized protein with NAD-binding domain and iron-sulfur cluster